MNRTRTLLREALEYAPPSGPVAPDLRGVLTADGVYACAPCVGRVVARGCGHLFGRGQQQLWKDQPDLGRDCDLCGGA